MSIQRAGVRGTRAEHRRQVVGGATLAVLALVACQRGEVVQAFPDSFVGVGIELRMGTDGPFVVRVLGGGAAAQAGVQVGDRLLAVDGRSVVAMTLGDVIVAIRGAPDTQVALTLERGSHHVVVVVRRQAMSRNGDAYHARPATQQKRL